MGTTDPSPSISEPSGTLFGDILRQMRRASGLTQAELAERASLSIRGLSDLERGINRHPRRETLLALAEALGLADEERDRFFAAARPRSALSPVSSLLPSTISTEPQPSPVLAIADSEPPRLLEQTGDIQVFLIADVRGYTSYTYGHRDEDAADLTLRFAAIASTAVEAHGGKVLEVRGDEVLVVFSSARSALRAALALQEQVGQASRSTPEQPIRCGIGLEAGEAVPVPGGYRGLAINLAARLCAQASPGEVLAGEMVIGLARRVAGLVFVDRGLASLKGFAAPVRVTQVLAAGLTETVVETGTSEAQPEDAFPIPGERDPSQPRHRLVAHEGGAMTAAQPVPFSTLLRRLRRTQGLTQAKLAERAGYSTIYISMLERGTRRPISSTAEDLAVALELAPEQRVAFMAAAHQQQDVDVEVLGSLGTLEDPSVQVVRVVTDDEARVGTSGDGWDSLLRRTGEDNLPIQLTSFIGRTRELAEVKQLLATRRLLTLTGAGGCGKTRLAIEVAADWREKFPDGAWLVELAALTDPQLVADRAARTLGVRQDSGTPMVQTLAEAIRQRRLLIILDNCEHLLLACAWLVDALLHTCPQLRILATSRKPLGILGETVWSVPPLSRPEPHPLLLLKDLMHYESVMLLVDRSQAAVPTFALSGRDVQAVAEICARLDGIPLAIELAAARIRMLSVGELATRLDDSFHLLTGGSRTALPRQQTLKATLDWSHDLLAPAEQVLFRCLAVFAGSFTLHTVEQVTSGAGIGVAPVQLLDLLTGLVDQSLVVVTGDAAGQMRYRLLEPIQQYAGMQLEASGEASALRERHAQCFLGVAETAEPHLEAPDQGIWLEQLDQDHDNLHAALEWFAAQHEIEAGLRLASALWKFWFIRGYVPEGRDHFARLLALAGDQIPPVPATEQAQALQEAGLLAGYASDYTVARTLTGNALSIRQALEDTKGTADTLATLGYITLQQGDYTTAWSAYSESLEIYRAMGNRQGLADALSHLALIAWYGHTDRERALNLHTESLAIWRELGDLQGVAWALHCLGCTILEGGKDKAAAPMFAESLTISRELGLRWGIAWCLEDHARLAARRRSSQETLRLLSCSAALRRRIGVPLPPQERLELEALVTASREELGPAASVLAWSEGEIMPVEQAVEALLG